MTFTPQVLSQVDTNNSSLSTLSGNSNFTGTSKTTTGYNTIVLTIKSDVSSSSGGIEIQFSDDGTTFDTVYTDTYYSSSYYTRTFQIIKKYYRMRYTNGGTAQTEFSLTSRLSTENSNESTTTNNISIFDNEVENTLDAFGKLRVSMPNTLLDIRYPGNSVASGASSTFLRNDQQINFKLSGTYSATYEKSKAIITGTDTGYYMTQSNNYCVYQPGKSLLFMCTGILNPGNNTFTARFGYFDSEFTTNPSVPTVFNGLYFQYSNGISVNIKNDTLTSIPQSSWNIDQMNGTGPSGLNLDFTKTQLFVIDMEWLGVGRVRFGFYAYGRIQYCHQFIHLNELTAAYTNNINLPISYTLIGGTGSGTIRQICATVVSEGGYNPVGRPFSVSNSQGSVDSPVTVGVNETPVLAIRGGGPNYYHQNIIPIGLSIIDTATNNNLLYRLRLYPSGTSPTTGTSTWTNVDNNYSVCQYAKSADILGAGTFQNTGSILLSQEYFYGRGTVAFDGLGNIFSNQILQVTANIDNVSDILVITCEKVGTSSTTVYSTLLWQEIY